MGNLVFDNLGEAAANQAAIGGRNTAKVAGAKRPAWTPGCIAAVETFFEDCVQHNKPLDRNQLSNIVNRSWDAIKSCVNRHPDLKTLYQTVSQRSRAVAPKMNLFNKKALDAAVKAGLVVKDNVETYAACFKCPCGGAVRAYETSADLKARWPDTYTDDYWMGCSKFSVVANRCRSKFTILNLQTAVDASA